MKPNVESLFDEATYTASYVVSDPSSGKAAIIDPVLDFDAASGRTAHHSADRILSFVQKNQFDVQWILETHVHADHLTAAQRLKEATGATIGIGDNVTHVQSVFGDAFHLSASFDRTGAQFGKLFADEETFAIGEIKAQAIRTPGHTPACMTYIIGDAAFVGDTMFMPDYGTARCDFPGGDARTLYRSIQRILALPDETRIFTCHDYKAPGRDVFAFESTVKEQRETNIHIAGVDEDAFVAMREERDAKLAMPKLILPSVQVNIDAGSLPGPEANGVSYLKLPLNQF